MRLFLLVFFSLVQTVVYAQQSLPVVKLTGNFGYDYQEGTVKYRGIYCFTECMDRKQLKLKKFDQDGTIHGTLWKSTGFVQSR